MKTLNTFLISALAYLIISCSGSPEITSSSKPNKFLNKIDRIAVVPSKIGNPDDLVLPDALETELLNLGLNLVDRTSVRQMVSEKGLDFTEILNGEEYFKLGKIVDIKNIIIVNSRLGTDGVSSASLKVIDLENNEIILSVTYSQPSPNNPTYVHFQNINTTAKEMTKPLSTIIK